ncbi:MAG TPA: adenylate/guanylate cyclase domain-containing protein [Acidimicrobiia bacterium]|nr:adenylate/guanylate cyclase domain-containing protein [Acidimicrobiia bacterium]
MDCPNCGTHNPETNRFCGGCGTTLEIACGNCGGTNPPGMKFCGQCGTPLGSLPSERPDRTLPLTERRLITVLFADLANYTTFSEGRDPEDVRTFLTSYFERAAETITGFGGTIDKFIGDAVMAVWGAATANEDDPERAVRAGLELVEAVGKLAADTGASDLALRVGIHTGEASVGPGGNQMGLVAGDNVNIASRLQSAAPPGGVLVGVVTHQAASSAIEFQPVGELTVKGKSQPVSAWRALRIVSERGGAGRSDQLEPPFIGRMEELRLLKDLLASVGRDQRSRMVSIIGEGGIGKSRLVWEFLKYIDGLVDDIYWHEGRSPAYGDGVTFWAAAEMIRLRADISETDPDDKALASLQAALDQYIEDPDHRQWVEPRLAAVLGLGPAPAGDRSELEAAVRSFFEGVSRHGTTVLVFEDVHWADSGLLDFVEELIDWWRDRPILILALARPDLTERRPSWGTARQGLISVRLGPLSDQEMETMVRGTVPGLPDEALEAIVARAAGVPMYAVELLRMLLAQGDLVEAGGGYQLAHSISDLAVPESLQAVIGARLDRLDTEHRALLQDAAVLGQSFTLDGLALVSSHDPGDLEGKIAYLVRRELIEPVRDPRSPQRGQFRFLQSLIRDVALRRMSRETRRDRHLDVARYYESLEDPELAVVVASHYLDALEATPPGPEADQVRAKALDSMAAAAARAADLRAHEQVLTISQQALALADSPSLRAPFWERMTEASTRLARREESERYGRLALDHYRSEGDEAGEHRVVASLGFSYLEESLPHKAIEVLEPHLAKYEDLSADPELARGAAMLARALLLNDRDAEAALAADQALPAAEALGLMPSVVDTLITKATAIGHPGRLIEARILIEGAIALADRHGISHSSMRGRNNFAHLFGATDTPAAVQAAHEAYDLAKRVGDRSMALFLGGNLAGWLILTFDFAAMEQVMADSIVQDAPDHIASGFLSSRAYAAWARGHFDEARSFYRKAGELIAHEDDPQLVLIRLGHQAQISLIDGELASAFEQAIDICRRGWTAVNIGLEPALWSMIFLNDRARASMLLEVMAAYDPQLEDLTGLCEEIVSAGDRSALSTDRIDAFIHRLDEREIRTWVMASLAAAAQFSSPGHPDRDRYLAEAVRRGQIWGVPGILELIERYVAP